MQLFSFVSMLGNPVSDATEELVAVSSMPQSRETTRRMRLVLPLIQKDRYYISAFSSVHQVDKAYKVLCTLFRFTWLTLARRGRKHACQSPHRRTEAAPGTLYWEES